VVKDEGAINGAAVEGIGARRRAEYELAEFVGSLESFRFVFRIG
jgi:hypothetical protein